jgi:hypothetical protein
LQLFWPEFQIFYPSHFESDSFFLLDNKASQYNGSRNKITI